MEKETEEIKTVDVSTATEKRLQLPDGSQVDEFEFLAWLGNEVLEIKKAVA